MDKLRPNKQLLKDAPCCFLLLWGSALALGPSTSADAATVDVEVRNYRFEPSEVTIAPGDTVRWLWREGAHTATAGTACIPSREWDIPFTPDVPDAQVKFELPGEYPYFCRPHCAQGMVGKVRVTGTAKPPQLLEDPIPESIRPARMAVRLRAHISGLFDPISALPVPGKSRRILIAERDGRIWSINTRNGIRTTLGDLRPWLSMSAGSGMLQTMAVHPDYANNGRLYTLTTETATSPADFTTVPNGLAIDGQTVLREWTVRQPQSARAALDTATVRVVLRVDTWAGHRNDGQLAMTPDGLLWFSVGGGSAQRPGATNSLDDVQGLDTILGKVLRIDPSVTPDMARSYSVPADNPFAKTLLPGEKSCDDGVCDEIFAYGFRRPGRVTIDGTRNQIYSVDSGDSQLQEVNRLTKGGNYGWPTHEGRFCRALQGSGTIGLHMQCPQGAHIPPLAQYDGDEGVNIVAGSVYRGKLFPALRGHYVFADTGLFGVRNGRLFYLTRKNITAANRDESVGIREIRPKNAAKTASTVAGVVADGAGELYLFGQQAGEIANQKEGFLQQLVP